MWFLFFKQKTAYELRISDWSSDVCSSDLFGRDGDAGQVECRLHRIGVGAARADRAFDAAEQVDLIADVEPDVIAFALDRTKARRRTRLARIGPARTDAGRRQAPGLR